MKTFKKIAWTIYDIFCYLAWFVLGGVWLLAYSLMAGFLCCVSLILIPVGLQFFKGVQLAFWPFRVEVVTSGSGGSLFLNIVWDILIGAYTAVLFYLVGALLYCTIIFMPIGGQYFKFAKLILLPIGAKIVPASTLHHYPIDPYSNGSHLA
jgi:uncharacterized membrane protein YccF (DUF307 family)